MFCTSMAQCNAALTIMLQSKQAAADAVQAIEKKDSPKRVEDDEKVDETNDKDEEEEKSSS